MTAIDQVRSRIVGLGLSTAVADAIEDAIASAGYELVPQPGGGVTIAAGPPVLRRRVPGSGGRGSVQICTVEIGAAGWIVFREHWEAEHSGAKPVRSRAAFLTGGGGGLSITSVSGFTEAGGDVAGEAEGLGLSTDDAAAGVAAIAAAGYAMEPVGGGAVTSPIPAADVERRVLPGTGDGVQLVVVTLGTAGWALWPERVMPDGSVGLDDLAVISRPSGYVGSVFDVA